MSPGTVGAPAPSWPAAAELEKKSSPVPSTSTYEGPVVFAVAGHCGLGALATAQVRGVWTVGESEFGRELSATEFGGGTLALTTKDWSRAIFRAIQSFHGRVLPLGRDETYGLEDEYSVMIETRVSDRVFSKIAHRCSEIRLAAETGAYTYRPPRTAD